MAKYDPDVDPLAGYDADLKSQLETDADSRTKILRELGGETRSSVDFTASRDSSALAAAAGAAVKTSLADIPRPDIPKPAAAVQPSTAPTISSLATSDEGASARVAAAGAAVNSALMSTPRVQAPKLASADPSGVAMSRTKLPQLPDADTGGGRSKALEQRVLALSNHIVSGSAGLPLQTSQPSLRDGLWHS